MYAFIIGYPCYFVSNITCSAVYAVRHWFEHRLLLSNCATYTCSWTFGYETNLPRFPENPLKKSVHCNNWMFSSFIGQFLRYVCTMDRNSFQTSMFLYKHVQQCFIRAIFLAGFIWRSNDKRLGEPCLQIEDSSLIKSCIWSCDMLFVSPCYFMLNHDCNCFLLIKRCMYIVSCLINQSKVKLQ